MILFLSFPAYGQDDTIPVSLDPTRSSHANSEEKNLRSLRSNVELNLDPFDWRSDTPYFPDYWDTYASQPTINYTYRYKGLHGLIYKHISRAASKFYKKALRNTWESSHLSDYDLRQAKRAYALRASDSRHPWWQRQYFFDHFSIENGGARMKQVTIGETYEILSLGPLSLSNSGKVRMNDWRISISTEDDLPSKRDVKDIDGTAQSDEVIFRDPKRYSFGISPPKGNLYTGDNWSISTSIKVGLRLSELAGNKSSISGAIKIIGFSGFRKIPRIAIQVKGKARPFTNDYGVEFSVALFMF